MLNFVYDHTLEHRDGRPVLIKVTEECSRDAINRNDIQCMEHGASPDANFILAVGPRSRESLLQLWHKLVDFRCDAITEAERIETWMRQTNLD